MVKSLIGATVLTVFFVSSAMAQRNVEKDTVQGYIMYSVLKKGDIPGIYDPEFYGAAQAAEVYFDDEPLMIVSGTNSIHAYSTWHLDRHEIVNDRIDGLPLAVTW
jgi:hypothetical protein